MTVLRTVQSMLSAARGSSAREATAPHRTKNILTRCCLGILLSVLAACGGPESGVVVSRTEVQQPSQPSAPAALYCPRRGASTTGVNRATNQTSRLVYATPRDGFACYVTASGRETPVNIVGRSLTEEISARHGAAMAALVPFREGNRASISYFNTILGGAGSVGLIQAHYTILRFEDVTVSGLTFPSVVIQYDEVNRGCTVRWTGWIDRTRLVPLKVSATSMGCTPPVGFVIESISSN
jgi:hypothetical protein